MEPWEIGNYEIVGEWFAAASRSVLDGGDLPVDLAGVSVLDVACGTGAVALEAARRGADVVGVDASPTMLAAAGRRAEAAGLEVHWEQRSFEDLGGLRPASVVTSSFGAMFAPDPEAIAQELDRATEPDGVIAVTAWHPDGAFGGGSPELEALLGPRPVDTTLWSDPDRVGSFFAATGRTVGHHRRDVVWMEFTSIADAVGQLRRHSGPWIVMFDRLAELGAVEQGERAIIEHFESRSERTAQGVSLRGEYAVTQLRR